MRNAHCTICGACLDDNAMFDSCRICYNGRHARLFKQIVDHLAENGIVQVTTYLKSTLYEKKHLSLFSANEAGVYVQRGKKRDCISNCGIRFGRFSKS